MRSSGTRAVPRELESLFQDGSLTGLTDGQLVERFAPRRGPDSEAAFAVLVARHGDMVWRTCRAVLRHEHDAADAFQATFMILVRKAGSLRVDDSIAPWLHRVALRAASQARRAERRRQETERRAAERVAAWNNVETPDDLAEIVQREVDRLPERHRAIIVLCDLEGRPYEEAARHLQCPLGTVQSRLSRAREKLRAALVRRGVAPALVGEAKCLFETPSFAAVSSTFPRMAGSCIVPIRMTGAVMTTAELITQEVLKNMIRARFQKVLLVASAAFGLLGSAWLVHARQAAKGPSRAKAQAAVRKDDAKPVELNGNWIIRAYPSGRALGLIRIENARQQPRVTLLSVTQPEFTRLAESKVDRLRIDGESVRFVLRLGPRDQPNLCQTLDVVVYLHGELSGPDALWGSMEYAGQGQYPAKLERTDRTEIDLGEGPEPAVLQRFYDARNPAARHAIIDEMLVKYSNTPLGQSAAVALVVMGRDEGAPLAEIRTCLDRAVRSSARYGRELEVGAMNMLVRSLVGREDLSTTLLEYARKAVALVRPTDPVKLQADALKNLAKVLRRDTSINESEIRGELSAIEARIAALSPKEGTTGKDAGRSVRPAGNEAISWARNFAAARRQARADGKLIMVAFDSERSDWCRRLDAEVFTSMKVAEAARMFVPVKVDVDDGEGGPLAERYKAHLAVVPTILFLDPSIENPSDQRIVGKCAGFVPPATFIEQLTIISQLPRDVDTFRTRIRPGDSDAMRQLATALAMQGRTKEAIALVDRALGPDADHEFDRWATVYNTIGDAVAQDMKPGADDDRDEDESGGKAALIQRLAEAATWYARAARVAKRPIDLYTGHVGAGYVASLLSLLGKGGAGAGELEAAARVGGIPDAERAFAQELLRELAQQADESARRPG